MRDKTKLGGAIQEHTGMTARITILAGAAALMAGFAALPAKAQYYGAPYYNPGLPPPPGYRPPPPPYGGPPGYGPPGYGPISCGEGAGIVASRGFRNVQVRECSGRVFRYTAFQRGAPFEVRVSSRTGQITAIRRI
jgi:hypothetical protein